MSHLRFLIIILALLASACKAGSEKSYNINQAFNGFDCGTASGELDQSTETTNEAAPAETLIETLPPAETTETTAQVPDDGLKPAAPGLGIGVLTSVMPRAKALAIQDLNKGLIVAEFKDGTVAIEHCTNIGNMNFSDSHDVER